MNKYDSVVRESILTDFSVIRGKSLMNHVSNLIGNQFNGSGQIDNLVPQNSSINRSGGEWYKMEQDWANALKKGSSVET